MNTEVRRPKPGAPGRSDASGDSSLLVRTVFPDLFPPGTKTGRWIVYHSDIPRFMCRENFTQGQDRVVVQLLMSLEHGEPAAPVGLSDDALAALTGIHSRHLWRVICPPHRPKKPGTARERRTYRKRLKEYESQLRAYKNFTKHVTITRGTKRTKGKLGIRSMYDPRPLIRATGEWRAAGCPPRGETGSASILRRLQPHRHRFVQPIDTDSSSTSAPIRPKIGTESAPLQERSMILTRRRRSRRPNPLLPNWSTKPGSRSRKAS
jgi:hypothetical protein